MLNIVRVPNMHNKLIINAIEDTFVSDLLRSESTLKKHTLFGDFLFIHSSPN